MRLQSNGLKVWQMDYKCPYHDKPMPEIRLGIIYYCNECQTEYSICDINRINNERERIAKLNKPSRGKRK